MRPAYTRFAFMAACTGALSACSLEAAHPNLVLIIADQWRGNALGSLGIEPVQTPHLDALATEGLLYTQAVSSYPVSSPARGMLMTGMYPHLSGVPGNCNSANAPYGVELPANARCWSDVLHDQGYELGYLGKWHLDAPYPPYVDTYNNHGKIAWNEWCPKERRHGFSHWIAYGTYDNHLRPMYWDSHAGRDAFRYVDQWGPEFEADRAIEYITNQNRVRDPQKPFALVVSMNPPHTGYELVPDKYKEIYTDLDVEALCASTPNIPPQGTENGDFFRKSVRDYYACMTGVDKQVGRIVEALKKEGLFHNTLVVFTSDHGDMMGIHNRVGKNIYYEEAMHIPMILTWPEKIKARRDSNLSIAFADLYPTLLSLMGFKKEIPQDVQTYDLSEFVLDANKKKEITQPYYLLQPEDPDTGYRGLRTSRYTFAIHFTAGQADEYILFDRETDPYQMNNIAENEKDLTGKFTRQLKAWLQATDDAFESYLK